MRWLLAGYCGLALIYLSVALSEALVITQRPRFYGKRTRQSVPIGCTSSQLAPVQWYKSDMNKEEKKLITAGHRIKFHEYSGNRSILEITDLHIEDSGVYFCKIKDTYGPGTGLQVARYMDLREAKYRSKMKDGLIILQGLMLAVFIAAILLRKHSLLKDRDSIYEEPETDHIYEGLAIETCGGGLYEELSAYTQAEGGEAPWE